MQMLAGITRLMYNKDKQTKSAAKLETDTEQANTGGKTNRKAQWMSCFQNKTGGKAHYKTEPKKCK